MVDFVSVDVGGGVDLVLFFEFEVLKVEQKCFVDEVMCLNVLV